MMKLTRMNDDDLNHLLIMSNNRVQLFSQSTKSFFFFQAEQEAYEKKGL